MTTDEMRRMSKVASETFSVSTRISFGASQNDPVYCALAVSTFGRRRHGFERITQMRHILLFTVLAALTTALPASAKQYEATRTGDVIQLSDTTRHMVVSVNPAIGNMITE